MKINFTLFLSLVFLLSSHVKDVTSANFLKEVSNSVFVESDYEGIGSAKSMCWLSEGSTDEHLAKEKGFDSRWDSKLLHNFYSGPTRMLVKCPDGFNMEVTGPPPDETGVKDYRGINLLDTGIPYDYRIRGMLNFVGLREKIGITDASFYSMFGSKISLQMVLCKVRNVGFCSPFIYHKGEDGEFHYHSNSDVHDHKHQDTHSHDHGDINGQNKVNNTKQNASDHTDAKDNNAHVAKEYGNYYQRSEVILLDVDPNQDTFEIDLNLSIVVDEPEIYSAVVALHFFMTNQTSIDDPLNVADDVMWKFDMSNIIKEHVQVYEKALDIKDISQGIFIFSYICIGLTALTHLVLLICVIVYRNNPVFKLSQGGFLMALLVAAIIGSTMSFLFGRGSSMQLNLYGPLIMIPLQFMLAIVIGRLWRIVYLMAPLMNWANDSMGYPKGRVTKKMTMMLPTWAGRGRSDSSTSVSRVSNSSDTTEQRTSTIEQPSRVRMLRRKFRRGNTCRPRSKKAMQRKVTTAQLLFGIFLITLPQIIMQILIYVIAPVDQTNYIGEASVGRLVYTSSISYFNWMPYAIFFFTMFLLLVISYKSRFLPSLFNEAQGMFSTILVTCVVAGFAGAMILVSDMASTHPDILYIVEIFIVLCFTLNMTVRLCLPKLKIVWSGQKVVVRDLISAVPKKNLQVSSSSDATQRSSIFGGKKRDSFDDSRISSTSPVIQGKSETDGFEMNNRRRRVSFPDLEDILKDEPTLQDEHTLKVDDFHEEKKEERKEEKISKRTKKGQRRVSTVSAVTAYTSQLKEIIISNDEPPPEKLMMIVIKTTEIFSKFKYHMLSGLQIEQLDWEDLRLTCIEMGRVFKHQVRLNWTPELEAELDI